MKERVPRGVKMERMEGNWFYCRFSVDEKPAQTVRQPTVLFDEGAMQRGWTNNRFGVDEK